MRSHLPRPQEAAVPDITSNSSAWFEHFDEDGSGSLEKGELTRALIKTFRPGDSTDLAKIEDMRQTVGKCHILCYMAAS